MQRGQKLAEAGAEVVRGDVQDPAILPTCVQGCDVVFHVGAAMNGSAAYQYNVNVQGTRNIVRAAHKGGAERLINVSSIAVYGANIDGPIDEDHVQEPSRDDYYMQSKQLGEKAAWDYMKRTGFPVVSVRPGFIYGPEGGLWSRGLYSIVRRYPMPLIDGGTGHAHPIFIDDLADLLITTATHPAAPGNAFHATPDPAPTWKEFLGYYAQMNDNMRVIDLPSNAIKPIGSIVQRVSRWVGRPIEVTGSLKYMTKNITFCMTRAAEILGWQAKTTLREGMGLTEPWLKSL
jgi:2-alkyl-3-oxoalkanoate reductase